MMRRALLLMSASLLIAEVPVRTAAGAQVIWTEVDAGSTPATSEAVNGNSTDSLIRISGAIDPLSDPVDVFRIEITDPAGFSARTTNGDSTNPDTQFDAKLALFDANGFGIYANDDQVAGNGNAALPAHHALSPTTPGVYLLAIYDDNFEALSAFSPSGLIFPVSVPAFAQRPGGFAPPHFVLIAVSSLVRTASASVIRRTPRRAARAHPFGAFWTRHLAENAANRLSRRAEARSRAADSLLPS